MINACGGGLLRDVITREEPLVMKPGQFYAMASLLGSTLFVLITHYAHWATAAGAVFAIGSTFAFRMLAIAFNWRTTPVQPWLFESDNPPDKKDP